MPHYFQHSYRYNFHSFTDSISRFKRNFGIICLSYLLHQELESKGDLFIDWEALGTPSFTFKKNPSLLAFTQWTPPFNGI